MAKKKNKQVRCGQLVSNKWFIPLSLFDHGAGIANVNSKMKKVRVLLTSWRGCAQVLDSANAASKGEAFQMPYVS
jgi:hypothetical protein